MAYRQKLSRTFEKFEASLNKLNESISEDFEAKYDGEILIEIVVMRFEYTFEGLWKTLKEIVIAEGLECASPLGAFKEAFNLGIIDKKYEEVFPLMVKKRNEIVHIYSEDDAKEIYLLIKNTFTPAINAVFEKLEK